MKVYETINGVKTPMLIAKGIFSLLCLLFFFVFINVLFRYPYVFRLGYLNDDAGMVLLARTFFSQHSWWSILLQNTGAAPESLPQIYRPLQLLSLWLVDSLYPGIPGAQHLFSLLLLSLGQGILFLALRPVLSIKNAFFASVLPAMALAASEANFWIADRHDLFLFIFFALGLLALKHKNMQLLLLSCIGGFLSNEKALVLPMLFVVYAKIFFSAERKRFLQLSLLALCSIASYALFRFYLFGTAIGGYDNRLFSSWQSLYSFLYVAPSALFISYSSTRLYLGVGVFLLLIGFTFYYREREQKTKAHRSRLVTQIMLFFITLYIASLPTARYMLDFNVRVADTRIYYVVLLTLALFFAWICQQNEGKRVIPTFLSIAFLAITAFSGREGLVRMVAAHRFTEQFLRDYEQSCGCVALHEADFSGVPGQYQGVHISTSPTWLKSYAILKGAPVCSRKNPCHVHYRCTSMQCELAAQHYANQKVPDNLKSLHFVSMFSHEDVLHTKVRIRESYLTVHGQLTDRQKKELYLKVIGAGVKEHFVKVRVNAKGKFKAFIAFAGALKEHKAHDIEVYGAIL